MLADGRRATNDEDGLASVLGLVVFLVRRDEAGGFRVGMMVSEACRNGRQSKRNGCGLLKRDVLRDLKGARGVTSTLGQTGTFTSPRSQIDITPRTFAVISAGTMVYCWNVALSFVNQPWKRLEARDAGWRRSVRRLMMRQFEKGRERTSCRPSRHS